MISANVMHLIRQLVTEENLDCDSLSISLQHDKEDNLITGVLSYRKDQTRITENITMGYTEEW